MRKPIIAANWKMHKTNGEVRDFVHQAGGLLAREDMDVVLCAPFTALAALKEALGSQDRPVAIGAQNMHYEDAGAFTGEISPLMLKDLGVEYVILGHSERRTYFHEDDGLIRKKVAAAFRHGLVPILCVGESLEEREAGQTREVVKRQTVAALEGLSAEEAGKAVIAYEPVWAIGTGKTASPEDANEVIAFIRSVVAGLIGQEAAGKVRIQYGGSVKPENIADFMAQPDIDGALVGGASLNPDSFVQLVEAAGRR